MMKIPRGHSSIYFSDYLRENWSEFCTFISSQGFNSHNAFVNALMIREFNEKHLDAIKGNVPDIKKIDMYVDTKPVMRNKLVTYTDGQLLDEIKDVSSHLEFLISESKRRGIKI